MEVDKSKSTPPSRYSDPPLCTVHTYKYDVLHVFYDLSAVSDFKTSNTFLSMATYLPGLEVLFLLDVPLRENHHLLKCDKRGATRRS